MAGKLTLDPSRWSYQDYADFLDAYQKLDWERVFPLIMPLVVMWTFDVPLAPDAYQELSFADLPDIAASVNSTLDAYIRGLDTSRVEVDMRLWNMGDFFKFNKAAKNGDVEGIERLMKKVVKADSIELSERLSFEQGALLSRAINEKTKELFSKGK